MYQIYQRNMGGQGNVEDLARLLAQVPTGNSAVGVLGKSGCKDCGEKSGRKAFQPWNDDVPRLALFYFFSDMIHSRSSATPSSSTRLLESGGI